MKTPTKSRTVTALLAGAAMIGVLVAGAPTASADAYYYGAHSTFKATGSMVTHRMTVYPTTTPTTGFDAGQYVYYAVAVRDETTATPGAWTYYGWQGPFVVTRSSTTTCTANSYDVILGGPGACTPILTDTSKTSLGSFTMTGTPGHRYGLAVRFAYRVQGGVSDTGYYRVANCINEYPGAISAPSGATCAA